MTMHLLPVFYTTTNFKSRKKKRKVTDKERLLQEKHDKFLTKMGVKKNYKRKATPLKYDGPKLELPRVVDTSTWLPCTKNTKPELTTNVVVGQAYNKGNLVVLSNSETKDSSTGKRR